MSRSWLSTTESTFGWNARAFQTIFGDYQGDDGPNVIHGDPDDYNKIFGYGGDDKLYGGGVDDLLDGGADNDKLIGGTGHDEMYGEDGNDVLKGGADDDSLYGGIGTDTLDGGGGNDSLFVYSYEVSAGDVWNGGKGFDSISLNASDAPYTIDLTGVRIKGVESFGLNEAEQVTLVMTGKQLAGFESFQLFGRESSLPGYGHEVDLTTGGKIVLEAGSHFDIGVLNFADVATKLDLSQVDASIAVINGGSGDDVVTADAYQTKIYGGGGSDTLTGSAEADFLFAGTGTDILTAGDGADHLTFDGSGLDQVYGGAGDDIIHLDATQTLADGSTVSGGEGADTLIIDTNDAMCDISRLVLDVEAVSTLHANTLRVSIDQLDQFELIGKQVLHVFLSEAGTVDVENLSTIFAVDIVLAEGVNDFTGSDHVHLTVSGRGGNDSIRTGTAGGDLYGFEGDDVLTAVGTGLSFLYGGEDNDRLTGGDGNDTLEGGGGVDLLTGGLGGDVSNGGEGADTFAYRTIKEFGSGETIQDFARDEGDKIDLSMIDPDASLAGDQSFEFIGTAAFSRQLGHYEVRYVVQGDGSLLVQGDINHDGKADFSLSVQNAPSLISSDFVL